MPNQVIDQAVPTAASETANTSNSSIAALPCNGTLRILSSEDAARFEAFKQSMFNEHQPVTPTESILVNGMVEYHWLAQRALRLQNTCTNPDTGAVTNEKSFSLYVRHHNSLTRAFHKSLSELKKLRSDERKAERGVEAQNVEKEKHEMKKQLHDIELFKKDVIAHLESCKYTTELIRTKREFPEFGSEFAAVLEKLNIPRGEREDAFIAAA